MRKLLLIMILIFSLSFLTGCGEQNIKEFNASDFIMLSLDVSSNGRIVQSLDFSVNSKRLENIGSEEEKLNFISNLTTTIEGLRTEFLLNYTIFYIQNPNEDYKLNKGVLLTNAVYNQTTDSVGFNIIFTSLGAWNYYHDSKGSEEKDENKNIFINKNESVGTFPFSGKIKISEDESIYVGDRYKLQYLSASQGLSFESELAKLYQPILIYNYSTYYNRLHSDADYQFVGSDGHSHHLWTVESSKLSGENKILIYSYQINVGYWYLFILIFALIFAIILYCILNYKNFKNYFKNKKNKK